MYQLTVYMRFNGIRVSYFVVAVTTYFQNVRVHIGTVISCKIVLQCIALNHFK